MAGGERSIGELAAPHATTLAGKLGALLAQSGRVFRAIGGERHDRWINRKGARVTEASEDAGALIDARIAGLVDWRGPVLARMRALIREAVPEVVETVKWRKPSNPAGVPVWERAGILCTGEVYKTYVKLTFAKGALLPDPAGLFNGSLGGHTMRAIDIRAGDRIDEAAFTALVGAGAIFNAAKVKG